MPSRFIFAILAAALSISPVTAQVRVTGAAGFGMSSGSAGIRPAGGGSSAAVFPGHGRADHSARFHQGHATGRGVLLFPYPYFYPDSDSGYASQQAAQPQVIVVPASTPAPPPAPAAPRESLLIEWQGDHFVRTTMSAKAGTGEQTVPDYSEKSALALPAAGRSVPGRKGALQPPRELPPAILVFHDGRREEVSEYTIMSGTIYSKADYWTTGSWTRKIQIADLDVPATLRLNQERGVKFLLPSSPNEVVVRP
jgi:hypothetical protein